MRSYPRNTPEAVSRIVALVLISDGHVSRKELETLNALHGVHPLGFDPQALPAVVQTLCEDLLMEGFDGRSLLAHMGDGLLQSMLSEVDDPQLQEQVLSLAESIVDADTFHSDSETAMLSAIAKAWQTRAPNASPAYASTRRRALALACSA